MVNFAVLRNVVLTSSKIIRYFENSQLIFTWHKMASMCAKFHCHTKSRAFCPPSPHQIKYATADTPNKIGLKIEGSYLKCKTRNKLTDFSERAEITERVEDALSLPLLSCEW